MARVVQQRSTPPYLLILFVLLFLVSTTLAVIFYVRYDESAKEAEEESASRAMVASENNELKKDINALTKRITGREGLEETVKVALTEANQALSLPNVQGYESAGLVAAIRGLDQKIGSPTTEGYLKEIADLKARAANLNDTIAKKGNVIQSQEAELRKLADDFNSKLAALRDDMKNALEKKDQQLARALAEKDKELATKNERINVLTVLLEQEQSKVRDRDARIEEYLSLIAEFKRKGIDPSKPLMTKPDGKVAKVLPDQNIVYINLGEKDQVTPGLPFTVYSAQTGIPEGGEGKAKIIVSNVLSTTSECHVVESDKNEPIMEGDLVANIVFNPTRTYSFVVKGEFDLYGEGRPDPLAARRIRGMIERFGGKVVDTISVSTDFVVLGLEPMRPRKPDTGASAAEWEAYKQKLAKYDEYHNIEATATSLQIPLLTTNKFLAFTGMVPKKRLVE